MSSEIINAALCAGQHVQSFGLGMTLFSQGYIGTQGSIYIMLMLLGKLLCLQHGHWELLLSSLQHLVLSLIIASTNCMN